MIQTSSTDVSGKTVFFFGAGASKSDDAPLTTELLLKAIDQYKTDERIIKVKKFIHDFFSVSIFDPDQKEIFPTFEEVLTPIDIGLLRAEEFSSEYNVDKLAELRDNLTYSICKVLSDSLRGKGQHHNTFVSKLFGVPYEPRDITFCKNVAFISTNYDILLDNQLADLRDSEFDIDLDYGINFRNFGIDWKRPRFDNSVLLFKLHGSLNWLFCPTCNSIKITPYQKGVMKIWTDFEVCEEDNSRQRPLIIPPTYQKVYSNAYLSQIWLRAEHILRTASHVVFIGYSLPEADIHIKYLLKKSLFKGNCCKPKCRITVIDKKGKNSTSDEALRYKRLFGDIDYQPIGFKEFAIKVNEIIFSH